jgi:predicted ferric reductase
VKARPQRVSPTSAARRHRETTWVALALFVAGLGFTVLLEVTAEMGNALAAPGGVVMAVGRYAGLLGGYLLLVMVVVVARIPVLDETLGQEALVRWHRRLGSWPLVLIFAHVVLITIGYAELDRSSLWGELRRLVGSYPDVLAAVVGLGLLVVAAVSSWRVARRRLRYETWWVIHLYLYLALALAFAHQLANGASFVHHPLDRLWWAALWAGTAGVVIAYRIVVPVCRSLYYRLRVLSVHPETSDVVSITLSGRHVERLQVSGGQFFLWRFLAKGVWWEAHPYSLSAMPSPPTVRVTVKDSGDHSGSLASLRPGTPIFIEGPHGAFTKYARTGRAVALVAGGIGVTPLRALLEDLPSDEDVVVILRYSTLEKRVLRDEIAALVSERSGVLHELVGPRTEVVFDSAVLHALVPDLADRDLFVCGPRGLQDHVIRCALRLGVSRNRIHFESFSF